MTFDATIGPRLAPLRHVLLGINAHVNYDLPQALLDVIDDAEFRDASLLERRAADHRRIDAVLAGRVAAEDGALAKVELPGDRDWFDRAGRPFNRLGVKVFLREARRKVWRNARLLSEARRAGPEALARKLALLERATAARVNDLIRPKRGDPGAGRARLRRGARNRQRPVTVAPARSPTMRRQRRLGCRRHHEETNH